MIGEELAVEVVERLEKKIGKSKPTELKNLNTILESFSKSEDRRKWWRTILINIARAASPAFATLSLGSLIRMPITVWLYMFWILAFFSIPVSIYVYSTEVRDHLDKKL